MPDLKPRFVHDLPPAPCFVGREPEAHGLAAFWRSDQQRVLSLVGIGGSGKTAIASRFLHELITDMQPRPAGVFVWSFYVDQNCSNFLREAYRYFTGGQDPHDTGVNLIYRLAALLDDGRPHLIALDGLERVQREGGDGRGQFGQLEEAMLRQLVTRFAVGVGNAKVLITTRFPVIDLDPWRDRSYIAINLDNLDRESARQLLRRRGVVGADPRLDSVLEIFGTHALTTDHLGIYLARFHEGDPAWAMVAPEPSEDHGSPQERKLRRILKGYLKALSPPQLAVMQLFCMFRFGATAAMVAHLASAPGESPLIQRVRELPAAELGAIVDHLLALNLLQPGQGDLLTSHPAVRDFFYGLLDDAKAAHVVAGRWYAQELGIDLEIGFNAMCRVWDEAYGAAMSRVVNTSFFGSEYDGDKGHNDYEDDHDDDLENDDDVENDDDEPSDEAERVQPEFIHEERVRVIAAIRQFIEEFKKEMTASTFKKLKAAIADIERGETIDCRSAIIDRDGSFALGRKPGSNAPTSPATLDLLEELIHHLLQSGDRDGALALYDQRMGGREHLAKALGDYERGMRIMLMFKPCPNMLDLAWYLRGVGDLGRAYEIMKVEKRIWSGTILCLRGLLVQARGPRHWDTTQQVAALLMGELEDPRHGPIFGWGEAIIDADYYLLRGNYAMAEKLAASHLKAAKDYGGRGMPETIRCRVTLADALRLRGRLDHAADHLERARPWITRSGSVEHLCVLHLAHARLLVACKQFADARAVAGEAAQLARRCGFSIYHIDLMNVLAAIELLDRQQPGAKKTDAQLAIIADYLAAAQHGVRAADDRPAPTSDAAVEELLVLGARHPECLYVHGECESLRLRAELLQEQGDRKQAVAHLEQAVRLHERCRIPHAAATKKRLNEIRGKWRFW